MSQPLRNRFPALAIPLEARSLRAPLVFTACGHTPRRLLRATQVWYNPGVRKAAPAGAQTPTGAWHRESEVPHA